MNVQQLTSDHLSQDFHFLAFHVDYLAEPIKHLVEKQHPVVVERIPEKFWTVGLASYKDKDRMGNSFSALAQESNERLMKLFPHFYNFQLQFFAEILAAPVAYMPGCSMPGFHVFKYCKEFEYPLARAHVDIPFNKFDWGKTDDYKRIFTHVIPVEVPPNAGMRVWNLTADNINEQGLEAVLALSQQKQHDLFIKHVPNRMCFHSGRFLHQIHPFEGPTEQWRITLQSHAILIKGVWYLYW